MTTAGWWITPSPSSSVQPRHLHQPAAHCQLPDRVQTGGRHRRRPSTCHGEIALGKNILMGFMTWEGYNYEDAILPQRADGEGRRLYLHPH